ncbi:lipid IV(A) 3-deoxy-D-manno-octulosonic acid transferase [Vibrio sp. TH_r3]|uniref:lipid IV(A) 3-deoxy-D-manno-octulosonic acid transferase n=1 Tax=Vibrio sp. TH_r3 TaxID=3082084 RepID=UPI002955AAFF|nr:lipid IV(A) 3-deoxy-D-manno-octulosonic acid transferase [Vibrio sp. TH_r3]MDV7104195.1 lipid IV(A) 3-deoxy-D-manno-octulosonic acid transferase [Vibrio sp. TH_r3]
MLIRLLYTLVLFLACPFLLVGLYRKKTGKPTFGSRWKEHWGVTPTTQAQNPIWIHAVSVGETIAVTPIIKAIKKQNPQQAIVLTTTTSTGAQQAEKLADLVEHRYMPIDFAWCVKGFLRSVKPTKLLIMETELWPNTLHTVAKSNIPITVLNARLSEKSCLRYAKFQSVFNLLAKNISQILCQHEDDAMRFKRLGFANKNLHVTGSIKFDISIATHIMQSSQKLRSELGSERPIWIAASTHQGEDEILLQAHKRLLKLQPNALMILVPRHPERFTAVSELVQQQELKAITRTSQHPPQDDTQVYIGDTMGEMLLLIGAADICFMAGSLLGDKVGGHNLLEPAALAKPLINGPSYYNFSDITQQLLADNAVVIASTPDEIAEQLNLIFSDAKRSQSMGQAALNVVERNRGALEKTLRYL